MSKALKLLLDEETTAIWDFVNSKCKVKLVSDYNYSVNIIEREIKTNLATIWYNQFNLRPDYFAHELLHVKINCEGYIVSKLIDKLFWNFPVVAQTWDRPFRNLVGNIVDHEKMFLEYLELGFEKDEFVGDFYERKCTATEINIEMNFCSHPSIHSYKYITAKFFLIKGTLDSSINYDEELKLFSRLAPKLYESLDMFWNSLLSIRKPYEKEIQEKVVTNLLANLEEIYMQL
ncbi:hypothetical protein N0B16_10300 [Chryseobacterium sp. GMJ5]|uniref:Uncharacterized protein n=1 Tax=Chryseobacterium gilvum TaxID=2976534 RepID=A0ABT2VXU9_9FLAO|nr:hypothetical protein [Chryseobacterium gilvum]MCU7614827.1 hypothetical protein [Chryseobacterium gilvum]